MEAGAQAVINGALVSAIGPCHFTVGSGGYILTGRALWPDHTARQLARDLYLKLIVASHSEEGIAGQRGPLFDLLGKAVAQLRTHEAQAECSNCAAAILSGDLEAAVASARRLTISQDGPLPGPVARPHPARMAIRDNP